MAFQRKNHATATLFLDAYHRQLPAVFYSRNRQMRTSAYKCVSENVAQPVTTTTTIRDWVFRKKILVLCSRSTDLLGLNCDSKATKYIASREAASWQW